MDDRRVPRNNVLRVRAACIAVALGLTCLLLGSPAGYADEENDSSESSIAIARRLADSVVRVEVDLQYDKGEAPRSLSVNSEWSSDYTTVLKEKRPLETPGYVLAVDRVLMPDLDLHPRFVKAFRVVARGQTVEARPEAFLRDGSGVILGLTEPLVDVRPLEFDPMVEGPYHAVHYGRHEGAWALTVGTALRRIALWDDGEVTAGSWAFAIVTDGDGTPAGVTLSRRVPLDDTWRGSPLGWPQYTSERLGTMLQELQETVERGLLHVRLRFRSPKQDVSGSANPFAFLAPSDEDATETERHACGVLFDERRILVLALLEPDVTARLETIEIIREGQAPVLAHFVCTLKDWGAFVVEFEEPRQGVTALADRPIRTYEDDLVLTAHLTFQGDRRVAYYSHARIGAFAVSYEGIVVPTFRGNVKDRYVFDPERRLVAIPLLRRQPGSGDRWSRERPLMMPMMYLRPILAEPGDFADASNVPLSAAEEKRLAWLGVEIQSLDRDLARANNVSHLTQDGSTGALVSYVYPDSPADEAGIEPGAILLRIHSPDRPEPLPVGGGSDPYGGLMDMLDHLPEAMRSRMPAMRPWPSVENEFNRTLTSLGFGGRFTIEYAVDGEVMKKDLVVTQGPMYFEAAPLFESELLGITVKDLTYEVRRYFQLEADAPGVIVAKIEPGSRAAVGGIQAFEIVTKVDDEPVADVAAFEKGIADKEEVQLEVKRRLHTRVVKIRASGE